MTDSTQRQDRLDEETGSSSSDTTLPADADADTKDAIDKSGALEDYSDNANAASTAYIGGGLPGALGDSDSSLTPDE